jgi:hypothetical protein
MTERERLEEALNRRSVRDGDWCADGKLIIEAARKYLATLPRPTKTVEVWRVEYARKSGGEDYWTALIQGAFESKSSAEDEAGRLAGKPGYACVRVTGPHRQEVPQEVRGTMP